MFHLHYDTDLARLADALAVRLAQRDPADLLVPQTVLVPQPGLQRWLVQRLAERHGVAANLEFIAPAQLVWRVLRAAHPELPESSAFDREVLRWRILDRLHDDHLPPALRDLVGESSSAVRRFELAAHLAQLFERYQGYRRDLLEDWERGKEPDDPQAELWRRLVTVDELPRSALLGRFLERHTPDGAPVPPGLPARLFAFGIINVSPDVLRVLGVLGRHCELHFFLPTPCREYWGDLPDRRDAAVQRGELVGGLFDELPNRLLVSLGAVGRDFVAQLFDYDQVQPDFEDLPDDTEPQRATLLQRVQADVITLAAPDDAAKLATVDPADRSLHVHVCHSPLREVQVLHDQLLDLLQNDPQLEPRDIAVMVPRLSAYAPCVEAVFGAPAYDDARRIPWTIADRPDAETHALVALFLRVLNLPASRLTVADVLETLAVPAVLRSFELDESALAALGDWAHDAGIRWGEDADDRAAHDVPAFEEYSWRFGRRRLLLGYMSGDAAEGRLLDGIAPLTDIEGADAAALGALFGLQRILLDLRATQRRRHTPDHWQVLLNGTLDRLVARPEGRDEERAMEAIRDALRALGEHAATAGFAQPLDWMTVRAFLTEQLQGSTPQQRFLAGGVSVCGLVPLRNVPFKMICVLGLDADSFPRRDPVDALNRVLIDRLQGRRKPGDRSVREDDRYLFLQTLMAATDTLYLSYTGIDMRKASAIEPSVVLSELLDHVCEGYFSDPEAARKALVTQHPMQPFSPRLFARDGFARDGFARDGAQDEADPHVFTYRHEWLAATGAGPRRDTLPTFVDVQWSPREDADAVELGALQHFLRNPAQAFLQRQAGLSLSDAAAVTDTREPLTLDGLQRHQLDAALARHARDSVDALGDALRPLRARALLPPLEWGRVEFNATLDTLGPGLRRWRDWRDRHAALPPRRFRLELGEGRILEGVLDDLHEGGYSAWIGNSGSAGGWLRWWLGALVITALDGPTPCRAWGRDQGRSSAWGLPWQPAMPDQDKAHELLAGLLDMYLDGQREPLPLPPRTAFSWISKQFGDHKPWTVEKAAEDAWTGGFNGYAESSDPWFALALRGRPLLDGGELQARFEELATRVYMPLCQALADGGAP